MRRAGCCSIAAVAAAAVLVPASATAAAWTPPATLSGPAPKGRIPDERVPEVAVNRRGESIAAWAGKGTGHQVLVASGTAQGRFGRPQRVGQGYIEQAAIGDDGTAVVAWRSAGAASTIKVAVRTRHGQFGRAQTLSAPERGFFDLSPVVAIDRDGDTFVAWSSTKGTGAPGDTLTEKVRGAYRRSGGRFGSARTIGAGYAESLYLERRGRVVVGLVATTQSGGVFPIPFSRTSLAQVTAGTPGGAFATPVTVSSSPTYDMRTALGNGGQVAVVWEHAAGPESQPYGPIQTTIQSGDGRFEAPVNAPVARPERSFGPLVAFGKAGELVTVWQEQLDPRSTGASPLYWATRAVGAPFGPRQTLSAGDVAQPLLAATGDGRAIMVWSDGPLRGAIYRTATGFAASSAPRGHIKSFRSSRLAAAGDFAAFGWRDSDGRLKVSVRKLPR